MSRYAIERLVLGRTGVLRELWRNLTPGVYIFNYHRIGDSRRTLFDPNVFSCDEAHFAEQVRVIARRFRVIGIRDLVEGPLAHGRADEPLALITFDDGYRDNFTGAYPILAEIGVPAVFFIPTAFVGTSNVPWWDEIAWMVRNTKRSWVELPFSGTRVQFEGGSVNVAIRHVLTAFKRAPGDASAKLGALRRALDCTMPDAAAEDLFVKWEDLREMKRGGMDIGSHSHSHQILSHLSPQQQLEELRDSKAILESHLDTVIDSVAYPVGATDSFTSETEAIAEQCGYRVGFSFINGANLGSDLPRFALRRIGVEDNASEDDLQYATAFAGATSVGDRVVRHLLRRVAG